jgi:hypothetical protein
MENDSGIVITLYDLTSQEEIFCQYFLQTGSAIDSAYHAGMLAGLKNEKIIDDLTLQERKNMNKMGQSCLKKVKVKKRISQLAEEHAKKYAVSGLDELLQYLTTVVRHSKSNLNNVPLANAAIRAIETMIKRYPEFANSKNYENDKYTFSRFSKEG